MKTENYIERFQTLTSLRAHLGNGGATGLDTYDNYMGEKPDAEWRILYLETKIGNYYRIQLGRSWKKLSRRTKRRDHYHPNRTLGLWLGEDISASQKSHKKKSETKRVRSLTLWILTRFLTKIDTLKKSRKRRIESGQLTMTKKNGSPTLETIAHSFEFHDFADLLAVARGKYFSGYANELIR